MIQSAIVLVMFQEVGAVVLVAAKHRMHSRRLLSSKQYSPPHIDMSLYAKLFVF
jgi:hypothetical protein